MDVNPESEGLWASPEKLFEIDVGDWRYQRPVTDTARCSHCGLCYFFCPTGCIVLADENPVVNLKFCKGCGICVRICPVDAIKMERET